MSAITTTSPQPTHRRRTIAIVAIALAVVAAGAISIIFVMWLLNGSTPFDTARSDAIAARMNEKKNFVLNETAKIGPVNYTVTSVERNATGSTASREWIVVKATATLNGGAELGYVDDLRDVELNGLSPDDSNTVYPDKSKRYSPTIATTFEYTFKSARTAKATTDPLVLVYKTYVNKTDSPLVGSEGAERINLVYTFSLM